MLLCSLVGHSRDGGYVGGFHPDGRIRKLSPFYHLMAVLIVLVVLSVLMVFMVFIVRWKGCWRPITLWYTEAGEEGRHKNMTLHM